MKQDDIDPLETQEWLDALESVLDNEGEDRAHYLMTRLSELASRTGTPLPYAITTPYRNTIPVPAHWSQKRKFLQGKRGIEKPPWQLPGFIEATGIQKLRDAYAEKEDQKRLKQKGKDRTTAKLGKIDIDYQVLHDAFFKFQTKPKMSKVGELYFEGKEFEMDLGGKKPGVLSEEVKEALGMSDDGPPPWLINMQRYGPPPSYPNLKIPGLSAPIPPGAAFGYHPGGWGKPPVDEYGNPIYGDVFGVYGTKEHTEEWIHNELSALLALRRGTLSVRAHRVGVHIGHFVDVRVKVANRAAVSGVDGVYRVLERFAPLAHTVSPGTVVFHDARSEARNPGLGLRAAA